MTNSYNIHLVNMTYSAMPMGVFLQRPKEFLSNSNVFANSSASMMVDSRGSAKPCVTISQGFVIGAGVGQGYGQLGPGATVVSSTSTPAKLGTSWDINLPDFPGGPTKIAKGSNAVAAGSIHLSTGQFNMFNLAANYFYANLSFGVDSSEGFVGMSLAPFPGENYTLTPAFEFCVSSGPMVSSNLTEYSQIGGSPNVKLTDFDSAHNVTVTLEPNMTLQVSPGAPT